MRAVVVVLSCVACASAPAVRPSATESATRVTALADGYVRAFLEAFPEDADQLGLRGAPRGGLSDRSLAATRAWDARVDGWLVELGRVDGGALWGRPEWTTYGFLRHLLESQRDLRVCRRELWPIDQLSGWQVAATTLARHAPVATAEDRAAALDRFARLARYIDDDRSNAGEGLRLGYSSPESVVVLVARQLDALLAAKLEDSPLYDPARRSDDEAFRARWKAVLEQQVLPAARRYRAFLDDYRPRARKALGVAANPDGARCYDASFRAFTTLTRSPDETFRLGQARVAQQLAEVQAITRTAFGSDDVPAMVARLERDPQNHFTDREQIQALSRDVIERAKAAMPRWFGTLPRSSVVLDPIPPHLEASTSSGYRPAAQDGSRPGSYLINLANPDKQLRSNVEITALHETYPGHHLQVGLESDSQAHPITLLAGNSAYREGWARYAEALAEEMGLYSSDYARIHRRLWPARGMVVDPALHLQGWTRKQAVDYMLESGRFTAEECDALVDRVAVWPGQLTAYDTGALEIFALRAEAERVLGSRFKLAAFHDAVLAQGAVTLPMLREIGRRWIEAQR
jgi:uncharacterized protein (DUF885 family)